MLKAKEYFTKEYFWLIVISLVYLVIASLWHVLLAHSADSFWFVDAARHFYHGSLDIYSLYGAQDLTPPRGQTLSYPPFSIAIITPLVLVLDALKLTEVQVDQISGIHFIFGDMFCAFIFIFIVKKYSPATSSKTLIILLMLFFTNPFTWVSSAEFGHFESFLAAFVILAWLYLDDQPLLSGVMIGVAIGFKTTALFSFFPLFIYQLRLTYQLKTVRPLVQFTAPALAIPALAILPLFIANPEHVLYAFIGEEQARVLYGINIWNFIDRITSQMFTAFFHSAANLFLLAVTVLTSILLFFVASEKFNKRSVLIFLCFVNLFPVFLGKWVSPHYFVTFSVLFLLFEVLDKSHVYVPILFFFASITLGLVDGIFGATSNFEFVLIILVFAALIVYLSRALFRLSKPALTAYTPIKIEENALR